MADVEKILAERGEQYGKFESHAEISQGLKAWVFCKGKEKFSHSQVEAIEMICHKLARLANGNPNHVDSWTDIAGYAKLEEKILTGKGV